MKLSLSKEWFESRLPLEDGLEIGAGLLHHLTAPTQQPPASPAPEADAIAHHVGFGRFIRLLRRQEKLSIEQLADASESTPEELIAIENDPRHMPEISTVHAIASYFKLPPKRMMALAGVGSVSSSRLREETIRFAACSEPRDPLTPSESDALQAMLKVIVEDSIAE